MNHGHNGIVLRNMFLSSLIWFIKTLYISIYFVLYGVIRSHDVINDVTMLLLKLAEWRKEFSHLDHFNNLNVSIAQKQGVRVLGTAKVTGDPL